MKVNQLFRIVNTYHAGIDFTEQNCVCFPHISEIVRVISLISEAITVLISMYFSWWFQIYGHEIQQFRHFLHILLNF